ncbi:MAG: EAL domain-containing protein [Helicobacteraceae bacterium]|nr:EAL domain-containing protein [Helicobacteraceae bacterium]
MSTKTNSLTSSLSLLQKKAKNISVLYVEDDPLIREEYFHFLQKFFEDIQTCKDGVEGLEALSKRKYDLIITDIEMPFINGIEMIEKIKDVFPDQKTIMISAHKDSDILYRSIALQVDGYLFKPLDRHLTIELLHKVTSLIEIENENRAYKDNLEKIVHEKTEELIHSFTTDKTTQLYSLAKFQQDSSKHTNRSMSILKVRKFKSINDFYGYESGDAVLRQTAAFLQKELQGKYTQFSFTFYRVAGSHFVITSTASMQELYTMIQELVHLFEITKMNISEDVLLLELDAAVLHMSTHPSLSNLDRAMRKAEQSNSVEIYTKDEEEEVSYKKRLECKNNLIQANQDGRFVNYYQGIVDNKNAQIHKYEALVRMVLEDGEVISPGLFLPIAKETKMYSMITKSVIATALEDFRDSECSVSINLSIEDIKNQEIRSYIRTQMEDFPEPSRVVFEILESDEIDSYKVLQEFIQEMHSMRCKVAIDDFGSGYSNFEHLAKLHADYIKIDGSLIKDIDSNNSSQAIVKMLRNFASQMQIKTIAEFVSKEEISSYVNAIGVDESQGYYFCEPVVFDSSMKKIQSSLR